MKSFKFIFILLLATMFNACSSSDDGDTPPDVIDNPTDLGPPTIAVSVISGGTMIDESTASASFDKSRIEPLKIKYDVSIPNGYRSGNFNAYIANGDFSVFNDPDGSPYITVSVSSDQKTLTVIVTHNYLYFSGEANVFSVTDDLNRTATFSDTVSREISIESTNIITASWANLGVINSDGNTIEHIYSTNDNSLIVQQDGQLYKSMDNSVSWVSLNTGLEGVIKVAKNSAGVLYATDWWDDNNRIAKSEDNGDTWSIVNTNISGLIIWDIVITDNDKMFLATWDPFNGPDENTGIYVSENNGENWTLTSPDLNSENIRTMAVVDNNTIYAGTAFPGGRLSKTIDGGTTWSLVEIPNPEQDLISDILVSSQGDVYVATLNGLFSSYDGGSTWDFAMEGFPLGVSGVNNLTESTDGKIYATPNEYGVFVLEGGVWKSVGLDLAPHDVSSIQGINGKLYAGVKNAIPDNFYVLE